MDAISFIFQLPFHFSAAMSFGFPVFLIVEQDLHWNKNQYITVRHTAVWEFYCKHICKLAVDHSSYSRHNIEFFPPYYAAVYQLVVLAWLIGAGFSLVSVSQQQNVSPPNSAEKDFDMYGNGVRVTSFGWWIFDLLLISGIVCVWCCSAVSVSPPFCFCPSAGAGGHFDIKW